MRILDKAEYEAKQRAVALRDAEFVALTSRPATDQSRAVVDEVLRLVIAEEARQKSRQRQRARARADAFRRAVAAFIGDLLRAAGTKSPVSGFGWTYRSVSPASFTGGAVSARHFESVRRSLRNLGFTEEKGKVEYWTPLGVGKRYATRFRATGKLVELAGRLGVPADQAGRHFIKALPKDPWVLKGGSTQQPGRDKIPGKKLKINYTDKLRAMEQSIKDLNTFLDQFVIGGGVHRGYIRVFNVGDHPRFRWNLGGRLYSQGRDSYQQMPSGERLKMTLGGEAVCELDIRSSYLTIFQARHGHSLAGDDDPYVLPELGSAARLAVKLFIAATFGNSGFPRRWAKATVNDYREEAGQDLRQAYPIRKLREPVSKRYPLLAALHRDPARPPAWAGLMFRESEAVLRTMLALKDLGIPSLSVHDSLIVPSSEETKAKKLLEGNYRLATTATPIIEGLSR
jgi:hypothetical protein